MKIPKPVTPEKDPYVISFSKVNLPNGWMANMAPYPLLYEGKWYRSSEELFQCLRFEGHPSVQEEIRKHQSPSAFRRKAKTEEALVIRGQPLSREEDIRRMRLCLLLKLERYPKLKTLLLNTGRKRIVEETTARPSQPALFWGARWNPHTGAWEGNNALGELWMNLRNHIAR
jgi:predicted NAD-dependent protein-ADP-ribosyltransferase YbiA (DUF1768 family)